MAGRPRAWAELVVILGVTACADPTTPPDGPAIGTYEAIAIAGAPLPFIGEAVQSGETVCHDDILAATLVLRSAGTFRLSLSGRFVCDSGVNLAYGHTSNGEFTVHVGRVDFEASGLVGSATFSNQRVEFVPAEPGRHQPTTFQFASGDTLP